MLNIDENKLNAQSTELKNNLQYFEKYGKPIVDEYSKDLDDKVTAVKTYLNQVREYNLDFDLPSLQKILIDLSTTIYYTNDKLEKLGLLDDMSGIQFKDRYNEAYLLKQGENSAGKKYSVEQLRNYAEQEAMTEKLLNFIYSHAARIIKAKVDSANELLRAVSKIVSSKIQEMSTFGFSQKHE